MAQFAYVALDRDGREHSGVVSADKESAARAQLEKRKWMVVKLAPAAAARGAPASRIAKEAHAIPSGGRAKLSPRDQMLFARQLATLVDASVPAAEALALIVEQQDKPQARRILADVLEGVVEGQRLSEAMQRQPRSFPALVRAAVGGGERSGQLGPVLTRLADVLARSYAVRSKVTAAMMYPTALMLVATIVIICLMVFVVPPLMQQFETFDTPLPLLTQIVIAVSGFLQATWPLLMLGAAGAVIAVRAALANPATALAWDRAALSAPIIGRWLRDVNASRFARAASALIAAGLPVLDSVRAGADSVSNRATRAALDQIALRIEEGEPLSLAMRQSGVFPPLIVYMAASGENSGALPAMLEKAADHFDQEFEAFTTAAVSLFEPVVIVIMGAVVAVIVLAIMLPILQLNQLAIG